ncbi:GstD1.2 family protein [Megaselia abdita]
MTIDLYYETGSPPCAAIYMTIKAIGLEVNFIEMDLQAKDHLKPEFLAINPQHSIPTLVDDGVAIWESRPIMIYLVEKYGKEDSEHLYPKDFQKRAIVNQRMFFDVGTFYQKIVEYYLLPIFRKTIPKEEDYNRMEEIVGFLNTYLDGQNYVAGQTLTLADISLYASAMSLYICGFDLSRYSNVDKWFSHMDKVVPGAEENRKAGELLRQYL